MSRAELGGARWRKSSRSGTNAQCVEVALLPGLAGVRDSKDPSGPALVFPASVFASFLNGLKQDRRVS